MTAEYANQITMFITLTTNYDAKKDNYRGLEILVWSVLGW